MVEGGVAEKRRERWVWNFVSPWRKEVDGLWQGGRKGKKEVWCKRAKWDGVEDCVERKEVLRCLVESSYLPSAKNSHGVRRERGKEEKKRRNG